MYGHTFEVTSSSECTISEITFKNWIAGQMARCKYKVTSGGCPHCIQLYFIKQHVPARAHFHLGERVFGLGVFAFVNDRTVSASALATAP